LQHERLKKLAQSIEALVEKDRRRIREAEAVSESRRKGVVELHRICKTFVTELNSLLSQVEVTLDPADYPAETFREGGKVLFQINVRGRILQIEFEPTAELVSTEDFRVPYTLLGAVRCFNQELLDKDLIEEQLLFYCVEKHATLWRFFDARTYRTGPFNHDYLISLLEQLI